MRASLALLILAGCSSPSIPCEGNPTVPSVLFFVTTDCPVGNAFAPEINRIVADYGTRGVAFTMVYTDVTQTLADAKRHAAEYGFTAPVVHDADRSLVRSHLAKVTPEAVVVCPHGMQLYRGRIDDRYVAPGQYRLQPTTRDLRQALDAVLAGRPLLVREAPAVGCLIDTE